MGNGYGVAGCTYDRDGNLLSRITITDEQLRRILNIDETQIPLNTDRSDQPATWVLIDKSIPDPGQKSTKSSIHITGLFGTNALKELMPVVVVQDCGAEDEDNMSVSLQSLCNLPVVRGQFGHDQPKMFSTIVCSTRKGSMNTSIFRKCMELWIIPLFPDLSPELGKRVMLKRDDGPGGKDLPDLLWLKEQGIDIGPGMPMMSGVNQEMDALYTILINFLYEQCDYLEKFLRRDLKKEDLGMILNGKPDWEIKRRPLLRATTPKRIAGAWSKIGAAVKDVAGFDSADPATRKRVCGGGVTRNSLNDARLRLPLGKRPSDDARPAAVNARADNLAKVQDSFNISLVALEKEGFTADDLGELAIAPTPKVSRLDDFNPNVVSSLDDLQKLEEVVGLSRISSGNVFIKIGPEPWNSTLMMLAFVERAVVTARAEEAKQTAKHAARNQLKIAAAAVLIKPADKRKSEDWLILCKYRKVPNISTLTKVADRKKAYLDAVQSCPDEPEDEPLRVDIEVVAGYSLSNVDELVQRIKACGIINCHRLPNTATGRASEQAAYFRSPPAQPTPSPPPAALASEAASRAFVASTPAASSPALSQPVSPAPPALSAEEIARIAQALNEVQGDDLYAE